MPLIQKPHAWHGFTNCDDASKAALYHWVYLNMGRRLTGWCLLVSVPIVCVWVCVSLHLIITPLFPLFPSIFCLSLVAYRGSPPDEEAWRKTIHNGRRSRREKTRHRGLYQWKACRQVQACRLSMTRRISRRLISMNLDTGKGRKGKGGAPLCTE